MKIGVIGAGSAGRDLVARLAEMQQDVIVIDEDPASLRELALDYDVMTIESNGADPAVHEDERLRRLDLLAAVTPHNEINLLACCWAKAAGARHTVARLSEGTYIRSPLVDVKALGVDRPLIYKEECTQQIFDVLYRPGALEVTSLLGDRIAAVGLKVPEKSPLAGNPLRAFGDHQWSEHVRFIGHVRAGRLTIPDGDTIIEAMDDVYVALPPTELDDFLNWALNRRRKRYRRVVIVGAGGLGLALARMLDETPLETVLIENRRGRAKLASERLGKCLVLHADARAASTMREVGIDEGTAFAAITGDEEMNVLCCIQAKHLGAGFTMARVDKAEYVPIVGSLNLVDRVISPNTKLIRTIIEYVRGATVEQVGLFHRIAGEVQEVVIRPESRGVGAAISNLKLPRGAVIAAVQRGEAVFVPTGQFCLAAGDRLAIYCLPETAARIKSAF